MSNTRLYATPRNANVQLKLSHWIGRCMSETMWFFNQKRERSQRKSKKTVWRNKTKKKIGIYLKKTSYVSIQIVVFIFFFFFFFLPLAKVIHVCTCPSNCDTLLLLLRLLLLWLPNILRFWVNICFRFHWIHVRRRLMDLFLPLRSCFDHAIEQDNQVSPVLCTAFKATADRQIYLWIEENNTNFKLYTQII